MRNNNKSSQGVLPSQKRRGRGFFCKVVDSAIFCRLPYSAAQRFFEASLNIMLQPPDQLFDLPPLLAGKRLQCQ
jgi:hypothetical protein